MRCLQKRPEDRYQSAAELRTELAALLSNGHETRRTPERRKRAALTVLILLAGIVVLAVFVVPTLRHAVIPGSKPAPQLRRLDQPDRALSLYRQATVVDMDNDPARALAFHNLGVMAYAIGDYQSAADPPCWTESTTPMSLSTGLSGSLVWNPGA